jgi:plastocyanin
MRRASGIHRSLITVAPLALLAGACTSTALYPDALSAGADGAVAEVDAATTDGGTTGAFIISIQNYTFMPDNLRVPPGGTVTVRNLDSMPHSVTSESNPLQFQPGAVSGISFDTGPFLGEASFTIPAGAVANTIIPYFCTVHRNGMRNNAIITVGTGQ